MTKIRIGIIKEGKIPSDKRVPLTPDRCIELMEKYPNVKIYVEPSNVRAIKDEEYTQLGIPVVDDLSDCDILMGVKEVNVEDLIPHKKYLFFSHTYKKQPYNRKLLKAILDKKIQLIDYELLKDKNNKRIIGFGRYAGIVGCYNGFRTYGLKHNLYNLKPANECFDRKEMEGELSKVKLPSDFKLVLTGYGRVGHGAREILDLLPIKEVETEAYLSQQFTSPVYTQLEVHDYNKRKDNSPFNKSDFYENPTDFESNFFRFTQVSNMYVSCHFWGNNSPYILTKENLQDATNKITVVADISCDFDEPIACTIRPSTIVSPIYGYNPITGLEDEFQKEGVIAVMAIDNLPCELPKDASCDFSKNLIEFVFPLLLGDNDPDKVIERASETNLNGELMPNFKYLESYLNELYPVK
jgi:alanine dehydrogenase